MPSEERRQHERQKTYRVEVKVASPEAFRASYLRDVSSGGLFVRSARPLPVGTRVVVQLSVASRLATLPGSVVRVEAGAGFGVRFDALSEEQRGAIAALIAEHQERHSDAGHVTSLAEAKGVIEAYEQALATLREELSEATERAETAVFERSVLVDHVREIEASLKARVEDHVRLSGVLIATRERLTLLETRLRTESTQHQTQLQDARGQLERESALRRDLELELERLRSALAGNPETARLRDEMKELSSQLDDERLKAMALQRALERFVAMGGQIPQRDPV